MQIGPFTITIIPDRLPGASHGFVTRINETRLLRNGAVRAHIYRDIVGFITGPAEVEMDATGFSKPVPTATEERVLFMLLSRAMANKL